MKLAIKKSYVLNRLKNIEEKGFDILICGTCLDYFKIREKVDGILKAYEPLPLGEDVEKELEKICRKAREE